MAGTLGMETLSQPIARWVSMTLVKPTFIPILTVGIFKERANASTNITEPLYLRS